MRISILLALLPLLGGCPSKDTGDTGDTGESETLQSGFEADLTRSGGCGDYFLYAHNEQDTLGLLVNGSGLALAAHEAGGASTWTFDLATAEEGSPTVQVRMGENLNHESCNDALDPDIEIRVDHSYTALSGSATLIVTPTGEQTTWGEVPASLELTLEGVVLSNDVDDTDTVEMGDYSESAGIGWLPG